MESLKSDGTLDYKSFVDELYKFYEIVSRNVEENVNWQMKKFNDEIGGLVLIRKSLVSVGSGKEDENEELIEESDEKEYKVEENENWISIEHQIVYHISYSVPVLYFKSCFLNGKSLKIDEIWKLIPRFCGQFAGELNEDQLITMITQFEHPILRKPYFAIHPCKTSELMSNLIRSFDQSKMNYILSWLSTIGPISGLSLKLTSI